MTKIYIRTFGCTANQADSEILAGLLKNKYNIINNSKLADLVIFNTCSLKTPTENRLFREIQELKQNQKIIIAGCYPLSFPNDKKLKKFSLLGSFDFKKVVKAVDKTLKGEKIILLSKDGEEKLRLPKVRDNPKIAKIVISKGCLSSCAYCAGKFARGNLVSYFSKNIIREAEQAVAEGCNKLYLTSQDCGCYGFDIETNIIKLLKDIINIPGEFKIRIGMMNPQWALKILNDLIDIYKNPKIMKFLHIPVQSGSDKILKAMNRLYTIKNFKKVVKTFREEIPNITISTDVIVGFPGETERDFKQTIKLLEWLKPEVLNLTKFWPRKGTRAAEMKQISGKEIKRRSKIITKKFNPLKINENNKKNRLLI